MLLVERLFKWSWVLFCYFIVWLAKPDSKMLCILLFEIEYSLEFVSTNPPFLSRPSDTKIQTAIIWWQLQQKSKKIVNVRLWTFIFRYVNLKIVSLIASELFNHNLSIVHPTLFLNFVIASTILFTQWSALIVDHNVRTLDGKNTSCHSNSLLNNKHCSSLISHVEKLKKLLT